MFPNNPNRKSAEWQAALSLDIDEWYRDYVAYLSEEQLSERITFQFIGGGEGIMSRQEMVLHVVNHGTYHRGLVGDMMYQVPVIPPATDLPVFLRDVWPDLLGQNSARSQA